MSQIIAEYKFNNILYDLIPEFNEGFEYTYEDILEGNVTTRTIYSNELPTLLRFGNSDTSGETGDSNKYNSLLEVLYLASSEIKYAGLMFHRCANVSYICPFILTNKNNSLHGIFSGCHSLTTLDVSNFDTSNVTDMSYAFYTNNLIELDLSDWDTHNVTNMNHILYSCQNLKTLNISNWNLNNVTNMGWFVNQCNNLNEIIMNDSDYNSINKIVSELPITTNGSECNFCISGVDDISKVNIREGWDIMSTITSNAICNPSSISVTGKTNGSGTISWSLPSIPTEATITSCKLTGTCTITDSSNKPATVKVNNTSVSSGVAFTINLGTENTTTSVAVTATGPHKNTKSTITFSNLVYTVDYEINVTYTVTFKDWDGAVLNTQTVKEGSSATAPDNPTRNGYKFTGWDKTFNNVTSDLTVTAQYVEIIYYTVTFVDWDGTVLKTQTVEEGSSATAPNNPTRNGYKFTGWDKTFNNVTSDLTVTAQYILDTTIEPEEPEEDVIEWTGLGTVATGLKAHAGDDGYSHDSYKINLDWENESFDIIIVDELDRNSSYSYNLGSIGDIKIGDTKLSINFSDGAISIYYNNTNNMLDYYNSDYGYYPFVISFTKKGIYVKSSATTGEYSTPEFLSGSENIYEINQPIYLIDDGLIHSSVSNLENPKYNVIFDLSVSEYSEQTEDPEEDVIEWTGIGTVATNLSTEDDWTYKLNIDWDTQYVEINNIVTGVAAFYHGANVLYLNNEYDLSTGDLIYCDETSMLTIDSKNDYRIDFFWADEFFIKISKDNGLILSNYGNGESFTIENYPIIENSSTLYLSSLVCLETGHSTIGEIKVVALEEPEEPDNNELIQGDINDETGTFEDEVSNVVKTRYIDISNKKQILVNVLTEDVYILKCYLYNANKELVKIIDISADKKRMFGVDLQKLVEEVMNDGNE